MYSKSQKAKCIGIRLLHIACIILISKIYLNSQTQERITIPTTRASIIPPAGYRLLGNSQLFYCEKVPVTLSIFETQKPFENVIANYSNPKNIALEHFKMLTHPEKITIAGIQGMKFIFSRQRGLLTNQLDIVRISIVGDSVGTLSVIIAYPDTIEQNDIDPLVSSIATIHWNRGKPFDLMECFGFSLEPPIGLNKVGSDSRTLVYQMPDTLSPSGQPTASFAILILPDYSPISLLDDEKRKKILESVLRRENQLFKIINVVELNKIKIDGVSVLESISQAKLFTTNENTIAYCTIIFYSENLIILSGMIDTIHTDQTINTFKESARSFKRKIITVDEQSECTKLTRSHKYNDAIDCYDQELKQNPESVTAQLGRAEALRLQGKYNRAFDAYTKLLERTPYCEIAYLGRARVHVAKEEWASAVNDYTLTLGLNDDNISGFIERAAARAKNHDFEGAEKDYKRALVVYPDSANLYVALGKIQLSDSAIISCTRAIAIDKSCGPAYEERAISYLIKKSYNKAIADLNIAIHLNPQKKDLYAERGESYSAIGENDLALCDMENGPNNASFIASRAFFKGTLRKVDASMKDFSTSLSLDTTQWETYFCRGIIRFLNGSYRDANADFRRATSLSSNAENRAWLYFSDLKVYNGDYAKKNLERYYSSSGSDSEDWYNIIKFLLGKFNEDQLLKSIKPFKTPNSYIAEEEKFNEAKCDTYFAIGLQKFVTGLKIGAKPYWKKCLGTKCTSLISYSVAKALLQLSWQN